MTILELIKKLKENGRSTSIFGKLYQEYVEAKKKINSDWIKSQDKEQVEHIADQCGELFDIIMAYVTQLENEGIISFEEGCDALDKMRMTGWKE